MPHDQKNRLIEFGDWVKARPCNYAERRAPTVNGQVGKASPVIGRVIQVREGQSCSGDFIWQSLDGMRRDAFGADEAEIVLKFDGSEPASFSAPSTEAPKTEEPPKS